MTGAFSRWPREPAEPPLGPKPRCEALLLLSQHKVRAGDRCEAVGTEDVQGHALCWVHASVVRNGMRSLRRVLEGRTS